MFLAAVVDVRSLPFVGTERISAVFLTDGQAYFGHLDDNPLTGTLSLRDVYYLGDAKGRGTDYDASVIARLYSWAASMPSGLEQDWVRRALVFISGLSPGRINALGFVTLAYAAIFTAEGIGLWMGKRWAEWLTVIVTSSLIPLEIWEMAHRPGVGKALVVVCNSAIVWYLVRQIRMERT